MVDLIWLVGKGVLLLLCGFWLLKFWWVWVRLLCGCVYRCVLIGGCGCGCLIVVCWFCVWRWWCCWMVWGCCGCWWGFWWCVCMVLRWLFCWCWLNSWVCLMWFVLGWYRVLDRCWWFGDNWVVCYVWGRCWWMWCCWWCCVILLMFLVGCDMFCFGWLLGLDGLCWVLYRVGWGDVWWLWVMFWLWFWYFCWGWVGWMLVWFCGYFSWIGFLVCWVW